MMRLLEKRKMSPAGHIRVLVDAAIRWRDTPQGLRAMGRIMALKGAKGYSDRLIADAIRKIQADEAARANRRRFKTAAPND